MYKDPPLVLTLCQIRFNKILNILKATEVAPFQQALFDDYPLMVPNESLEVQFEAGPNQASVQSNQSQTSWRFSDLDDIWTVVLAPDLVSIETRSYSDFSDFLTRVEKVVVALLRIFRPSIALRIGLRYINEIRLQDDCELGLRSRIRHELLGPLALDVLSSQATQSVNHMTLTGPNGLGLNLQYGFLPQGTLVAPRKDDKIPEGAFYFLDYDVYQVFEPRTFLINNGRIKSTLDHFHQEVWKLFRWSITPEYATALEDKNANSNG